MSLNLSPGEAAFTDWQPKQLEPLQVKPAEEYGNDSLTVFGVSNWVEDVDLSGSLISQGYFGDWNGQEDVTLEIEDDLGNIAGTFSLTGNGYGQVFKDDRSEYVFFWGTDGTTSVQISAGGDLQLNDYIGSSLQVQTQGSITTHNIFSNGGTLNLISTWESVTSQGDIATNGGRVKIEGVDVDVVTSQIEAGEVTLSANHNLTLEESQLQVSGDLNLSAQNTVQVSDSITNPFVARAGGQLKLQGNRSIEIVTSNHPQTSFESGEDLSLVSDGQISGDAHFSSQGNFTVLNLQAEAGRLASFSNPVINSSGSVFLGDYYGTWLEVNAGGNITAGTIDTASGQGNGGSITLTAVGDITTGSLSSYGKGRGGDITFTSSDGKIDTNTLDASGLKGGGTITLAADGDISTGNLYTFVCPGGTGKAGDITVTSNRGTIDTEAGYLVATGMTAGGAINLTAAGDIHTSTLYSFVNAGGTGNGGDITLKSSEGTIDTRSGTLNATGLTAGGAITLTAAAQLSTKDLKADGRGGDTALGGHITLGAADEITTASLSTNKSGVVSIVLRRDDAAEHQTSLNVTTGNITATQVEILSDGGFTAAGQIYTDGGDIEIMTLDNITLEQVTARDGATHLTSGLGAIAATEAIRGDRGLIALARQDITTKDIDSPQDVVILKSSQGAIAVNRAISSNGDVSLAAAKDVVAQEITSYNGGVALIGASGTVKANGAIAAVEDVTLGASGNVVAQNISARLGTVALVSTEGTVKANGAIYGGIDVEISARQDVGAGRIDAGAIAIDSEQGTVTLGHVTSDGDSIYISALGYVVSGNLISGGGEITVVSEQAAVTTGYLRSDGYGTGGKIYLQAFGYIRVIGSVKIGKTDYSIYTGIKKKDWITIVPQSGLLKFSDKAKFVIGNASLNGTVAKVSHLISFKNPQDPPSIPLLILEVIKSVFQEIEIPSLIKPTHVEQINPITGERYDNIQESELVEKLTPAQRSKLKELVNKNTDKEEWLKKEEFRQGKVDDMGCFYLRLGRHLGTYGIHDTYATWVTGDSSDILLMEPEKGIHHFYDGEVYQWGQAFKQNLEPLRSLAEVKTEQYYLIKAARGQQLNSSDRSKKLRLEDQLNRGNVAAQNCGRRFFFSFDNEDVANAARKLYGTKYQMVNFYYIKSGYPDF